MKYYSPLIAVWLLICGGITFLGFKLWADVSTAEERIQQQQRTSEVTAHQLAHSRGQLNDMAQHQGAIKPFTDAWRRHVEVAAANDFQREIVNNLVQLTQENYLSPTATRPRMVARYEFDSMDIPGSMITWSVRGTYSRIMTWLGGLEERYPLMRLEELHLTPVDSGGLQEVLELEVTLFYPNFTQQLPPAPR